MKIAKQFSVLFVLMFLIVFATGAKADSNPSGGPAPVIAHQAKYSITVQGNEYDLLTLIIDFPTGAGFPEHFHGGNVVATMLSGELTLKEKGTERVVKTGESWTEAPGAVHSVVNKGASARVAVSILLPKGAEMQTPVK
jgi:quercetin dioxygenase-like cupin family protein